MSLTIITYTFEKSVMLFDKLYNLLNNCIIIILCLNYSVILLYLIDESKQINLFLNLYENLKLINIANLLINFNLARLLTVLN